MFSCLALFVRLYTSLMPACLTLTCIRVDCVEIKSGLYEHNAILSLYAGRYYDKSIQKEGVIGVCLTKLHVHTNACGNRARFTSALV